MIVDSKYYNDCDEEKVDYKQLYYNYHMAFLDIKLNEQLTYKQVLDEYSKWANILVKPSKLDDNKFSIFEFDNQRKLYSFKININKYVKYYVNDKGQSQLVYEFAHSLELENLQNILKEAQS